MKISTIDAVYQFTLTMTAEEISDLKKALDYNEGDTNSAVLTSSNLELRNTLNKVLTEINYEE